MSTVRFYGFIAGLAMLVGFACALTPIAAFNGTPTSGTSPLTVSFTDQSTGNSTGWAWYFGDETYNNPWTEENSSAAWTSRVSHTSVVMPDGSIVVMGGYDDYRRKNDVWKSTDKGVTWNLINKSAGWSARSAHSSVVMPDGDIILMGGNDGNNTNDTWRSIDGGATWTQVNASSGWSMRCGHTGVAMPDGNIILMGGGNNGSYLHDVWKSTDEGVSWTLVNLSPAWTGRVYLSSVVMPDGSIVLTGGQDSTWYKNDTWWSMDEGATWTRMNASGGWSPRQEHSSVVMPDGSIVLLGGWDATYGVGYKNDTWRSTDNGATWTLVNSSPAWSARCCHTSVVLPDGSIILMGGIHLHGNGQNDTWRFMPTGSSIQNPLHTYKNPGIYPVALQAYNAGGYDRTRKAGYITVYSDEGSDSDNDIPSTIITNPSIPSTRNTITETVNAGGGSAVSRAEVTGTNLGKNLVVTAFPRNNLPSDISLTQTTVYQYISVVSSTIPGVVDQATLEFSVPQSWLTEHGFTAGDIVMMHYDNGQWVELDTRYVSQKSGNVYYRATTPGFSYFAIVYQKDGTDMGAVTPVATTAPTLVAVLKAPVQEAPTTAEITREKTPSAPPANVTNPSRGIPMTTIIIGTTGAIATVIGTVLIRRWWIRKQNPTLFRRNDRY